MRKRTEVRSQAEFNACIKLGNIAIVIGCRVEAWGNSSVVAWENSSVVAWENSSVVAWGNSSVVAWENSSVVAWGNSSVEAWGNSSVVAWENSSVVAWENSSVVAWENSSVVARGNSSVVARGNSSVVAWENSSVVARGNSSVVARGNSSVVAWENSSVVARGSVFVRLFSALSIKASAYVAVMIHGEAKTIIGGNQLKAAPPPNTGAEWCDYWDLDPSKANYLVPNIDQKILASIEANKSGLNMSNWHGRDDCNETNWCETTHCRAGYAICLAGAAGFALEKKYGPETAGQMIYAVSRPDLPLPDFHASTTDAMADIKTCAAQQESS